MTIPKRHTVHRGGPKIQPAYLVGRKLLVVRVPTVVQMRAEFGPSVANADLEAGGTKPPKAPRADGLAGFVVIAVLSAGRVIDETVRLDDWDVVGA